MSESRQLKKGSRPRAPRSPPSTEWRPAEAAAELEFGSDGIQALAALQRSVQAAQRRRDAAAKRKKQRDDARDSGKPDAGDKGGAPAMQAGRASQPRNPLPGEQLLKPGVEAQMSLRPRYHAPDYVGSGKLQGMVALITGGDSGIGRAVATLFAREGADIVIAYLNEHKDARESARAVRKEGRDCLLVAYDVRDSGACEQAVQAAVKRFGGLDILVNNAAFQLHADGIDVLDDTRLGLTFDTNILGYFRMTRAALPHIRERGSIINTGSVTGLEGSGRLLDYASTKGAIHAFTKSLASNLVERNIRVNAVAPGPVWTPLNPADKDAESVREFGADTDIGRAAQPEEIAPAYVFLAAPSCASYITGIVLPITGTVGAM